MWRFGVLVRSPQRRVPRRLLMARWSDSDQVSHLSGSRQFSRQAIRDLDEEGMADFAAKKKEAKAFSSSDMEFYSANDFDDEDEEDEATRVNEEYRRKQEEIQRELDTRTGRPWKDPWEITEDQWMSTTTFDDLPDFSPEYVSRISQERIKVHPDGIPTLATLSNTPLPPPAYPHPGLGEAKAYAAYRKRSHYRYISEKVINMAKLRVEKILALPSWDEKQDAVDELFETLEEELKGQEEILGKHPEFGKWVERALQEYLVSAKKALSADSAAGSNDPTGGEVDDENSEPIFMDCFNPNEPDEVVPRILSPLKPQKKDGVGRMVEEWELSAHKKTKRILIRQGTRSIAQILEQNTSSRIFVNGRKGVGKTAAMASIVASARRSGHIVLYLPDGDRLRKNGYFVTPNALREGMFDLQDLSQEACQQLLACHEEDLKGMEADKETMERYFKDTQLKRITDYSGESMTLVDLLNYAEERKIHAPMCYSVVVDRLMNQEEKPFLLVMDQFNCYYDRGHYFHMAYDEDVRDPIPYEKINLFEHAMGAMALSTDADDDAPVPMAIKRGGIIVGVTESHAVPRGVTDGLTAFVERQSEFQPDLHVVEVPRFSDLEADHILANFECTGIGNFRLDRGDTIMDEQEVAYLKMISGNIGQKLLDASVL